jgi:hypothetical protein
MNITSNAAPDEKDSPFYKANESFYKEFDKFIINKGGETKGKYNAWSYLIHGKINSPKEWVLKYKKTTVSSGNLLIDTEKQSLLTICEWSTKVTNDLNKNFLIRKKKRFDSIRFAFNKNVSLYSDNYVIRIAKYEPYFLAELTTVLKDLFDSNQIYQIELKDDILKIELRSKLHYFDNFEKLIKLRL